MSKNDFMKAYWEYRKDGGQMSMGAYADAVREGAKDCENPECYKHPFKTLPK